MKSAVKTQISPFPWFVTSCYPFLTMSKEDGQQPHDQSEPQEFSFANPFVWHGESHEMIITEAGDTLSLQIVQGEEIVIFDIHNLALHDMRRYPGAPGDIPPTREAAHPPQEKTEKEPTIKLTGTFDTEITFRQVQVTTKTGGKEKQWLHKFSMVIPGDTAETSRSQVVASLGKPAQRHKQLALEPGEEITVTGKMQHRTDTKSQQTTDELFAFAVRRTKPKEEVPERDSVL